MVYTDPQSRDAIQKKLLSNFKFDRSEFSNLLEFSGDVGFTVEKEYESKGAPISLFRVVIFHDDLRKDDEFLPLFVSAAYGTLSNSEYGGTLKNLGNKSFRRQPIDIQTYEDYFYHQADGKIYKKSARIDGLTMLREVAKAHQAKWTTYKGLSTRLRLECWKLVGVFLRLLAKAFKIFLFAISGTRYSYDPILAAFEEERGVLTQREELGKVSTKTGKTIPFLGYEASAWSVLFYCFLHLFLYILFTEINLKPHLVVIMLKNNFLTVAYVIASLWLIERAIPNILKVSIKHLSALSFRLRYRKVRIKL